MTFDASTLVAWSVWLILAAPVAYLALAMWRVWQFHPGAEADPEFQPPLTILKPLCGTEPGLYERLLSVCRQPYPALQIVFGVADPDDPVLPIVRRIMTEFPARDIALVVDSRQHGANRKVSNLVNMLAAARYDILLLCDSDVGLAADCLGAFIRPMRDRAVGAVTAVYRGLPDANLESRLGALLLNDAFFPATLITEGFGPIGFCNGQLTAVRRASLEAIGGFAALADQLADDFMLGRLLAGRGDRIVLSRIIVDVSVHEDRQSLPRHELRWARTIRATEPVGHCWSVVTHALPIMAILAVVFPSLPGFVLTLLAFSQRYALHRLVCQRLGTARQPAWLLPAREMASLAIWLASYGERRIQWRNADFVVARGGGIRPADVSGTSSMEQAAWITERFL